MVLYTNNLLFNSWQNINLKVRQTLRNYVYFLNLEQENVEDKVSKLNLFFMFFTNLFWAIFSPLGLYVVLLVLFDSSIHLLQVYAWIIYKENSRNSWSIQRTTTVFLITFATLSWGFFFRLIKQIIVGWVFLVRTS